MVISVAAKAAEIERDDSLNAWNQASDTARADALHIWPEQLRTPGRAHALDHGVDISP